MVNVQVLGDFPEEVRQLEGHLSWAANAISHSVESNVEPSHGQRGMDFSQWLLDNDEYYRHLQQDDDEGKDDLEKECNSHNPKYARLFASQLNKSTKRVYKGDWDGALEQLRELKENLGQLSGEHLRLSNVTMYCIDALEWSVRKLSGKDNEFSTLSAATDENIKSSDLKEKWNELQDDDKNQAVIHFLKGSLERELCRWSDENWLEVLLKVISLDPDYHMWYHHAFRCMRTIRREFNKEQKLKAPPSQEVELCSKAHDLAPQVLLSNYDLGMVLKDSLWMTWYEKIFLKGTVEACTFDVEETFQKCLKLFGEVESLAKDHGLQEWLVRSKYQKADLLLHVKNSEENVNRGWAMLLELLKENPSNAYLHQKVGMIYQYGTISDGKRLLRNFQEARQHFKRALELRQRNYFFCLRDYIKLFRFLPPPQPIEEALQLLSEALKDTEILAEESLAKVRIWRGALVWVYNPEGRRDYKRAACEDWLYALKNCPNLRDFLIRYIWNYKVFKYVNNKSQEWKICTNELKQSLEKIKADENSSEETLLAIEIILEEIKKNPRQFIRGKDEADKRDKNDDDKTNGNEGIGNEAKENLRQSNSNKPWLKKPARKGLADEDDNWRVKK